jgi:hypothetical protein
MKLSKIVAPVLVLSGLFVFLLLTNPKNLPLVAILIPFAAIGVFLFTLSRAVYLHLIGASGPKATIWAVLTAFEASLLMLLSSLHQITWKDILLAVVFGILFVWYAGRYSN